MEKKLFELKKETREIGKTEFQKNIKKAYKGITLDQADRIPEIIKSFETLEKAKEELKNYSSSVRYESYNGVYLFEEFYIEENIYEVDEDGDLEWIEGGDIWEFSEFKEENE